MTLDESDNSLLPPEAETVKGARKRKRTGRFDRRMIRVSIVGGFFFAAALVAIAFVKLGWLEHKAILPFFQSHELVLDESAIESAKVDPAGFTLSLYVTKYYSLIIFLIYWILASLSVLIGARTLTFLWTNWRRRSSVEQINGDILRLDLGNEDLMANLRVIVEAKAREPKGETDFWSIWRDITTIPIFTKQDRSDLIEPYFLDRFRRVMDELAPTRIPNLVSSLSPAIGFLGTLLGLLFVFTNAGGSESEQLANSPQFSTGLKVAVLTSIWGLTNLTISELLRFHASNAVSRLKTNIQSCNNLLLIHLGVRPRT